MDNLIAKLEGAAAETERLTRELDITNADHIALWLEANMENSPLGWLACRIIEAHETVLANPPRHQYWGAGEPDCPRDIKAGNGELHTLRCKVCGVDSPRDDICPAAILADTHFSGTSAAPSDQGWRDATTVPDTGHVIAGRWDHFGNWCQQVVARSNGEKFTWTHWAPCLVPPADPRSPEGSAVHG